MKRWTGKVNRVVDGDTVVVGGRPSEGEETVRLWGIDAPEKKQDYGGESTRELQSLLSPGESVEVVELGRGRFGRLLALLFAGGEDVQKQMIMRGAAWQSAPRYRLPVGEEGSEEFELTEEKLKEYEKSEREARSGFLGLWKSPVPTEPWLYRSGKRGARPVSECVRMSVGGEGASSRRIPRKLGYRHRKKKEWMGLEPEKYKKEGPPHFFEKTEISAFLETPPNPPYTEAVFLGPSPSLPAKKLSSMDDSLDIDPVTIDSEDVCYVTFDPETLTPISISENCEHARYFQSVLATPVQMGRYFSDPDYGLPLLEEDHDPGKGVFAEHRWISARLREGVVPVDRNIMVDVFVDENEGEEASLENGMDVGSDTEEEEEEEEGGEGPEYKEVLLTKEEVETGDIVDWNSETTEKRKIQSVISNRHYRPRDKVVQHLGSNQIKVERDAEVPVYKVYRPIGRRARGRRGGRRGGRGPGRRGRAGRGGRRRMGAPRRRFSRGRRPFLSLFSPFGVRRRRRLRRYPAYAFPPIAIPPLVLGGLAYNQWLASNYPSYYSSGWRIDEQTGLWIRPSWLRFDVNDMD